MMLIIEAGCLAIVALYYIAQTLRTPHVGRLWAQITLLSVGSWLGEQGMIMAYGFYTYAPTWDLFVGHVPLLIVLIWPVVIHSAWRLARLLTTQTSYIPWLGALLVLADAALIEPVCVHAGFWRWHQPGLFQVPPIGIIGWAIFAGWCIWLLEAHEQQPTRPRRLFHMLWLPALATHLSLLALWWLALRWLNQPIPSYVGIVSAWILMTCIAVYCWQSRAHQRVPLTELLLRVPGACFFFIVLWLYQGSWPLFLYIVAFVPPYLTLLPSSPSSEGARHASALQA